MTHTLSELSPFYDVGWGRPGSEQKRKRNAEEDPDSEQRASPPPPLPPMPKAVSVTSLSELVESLTSARSSPSLSSSSGGEGVENAPGVENEQAQAHDSHCEELKIRGHQEEEKVATSIEVTSGEAEKRELSVEAAPNVNKISASLGRSSSVFNA